MAINPLQAPINYMALMPDVNIGKQFAELGQVLAQRRERQQAETLRQEYATDLQNAISNPTQSTWAQMIAKYPKQREAFGDAAKIYGQERLNNEFRLGAEISTALENNRPDVASDRLKTALEGYKRSGISAGTFQQVADLIEAGNVTGAQAATNFALATLDPERFKKMVDANQTSRESPYKLKETQAKANEAVTAARIKIQELREKLQNESNSARKLELENELKQAQIEESRLRAQPAPGYAIIPEAERVILGLPAGVYQKNLGTKKIEPVSREPLVSVSVGQQGERDKLALKELDIPRAQEFSAAAASARTLARDSRVIADLLKGQGGGAAIKLSADFAKSLGFQTDTVKANDLANALAIRGATQLRPPGSGSTSDIEFKAFVSAFPSLANSEGGRELMAKYADAFAKRTAKLADHSRRLIREDKYSEEEIARFDESLGPILREDFYKRPGAPAAPAPTPAPAATGMPSGFRVIR